MNDEELMAIVMCGIAMLYLLGGIWYGIKYEQYNKKHGYE